jgi:hypothetical protein
MKQAVVVSVKKLTDLDQHMADSSGAKGAVLLSQQRDRFASSDEENYQPNM